MPDPTQDGFQDPPEGGTPSGLSQDELENERARLERELEDGSGTLPDEHPDLQRARTRYGLALVQLGDFRGARKHFQVVVDVNSRTLPVDHLDLQKARANLALALSGLGDFQGAHSLEASVFATFSRTLPDHHPDLQKARGNLAGTLSRLGDPCAAKPLFEKVLEVRSCSLPDDHLDLQGARLNLAANHLELGNPGAAKPLQEQAIHFLSRTLPDDHLDLQKARANYALTIRALGDLDGAQALQERILEAYTSRLSGDHPYLQAARINLAATIKESGHLARARELEEQALGAFSATVSADHTDLLAAQEGLALTMRLLGDLRASRSLLEKVLEARTRTLPSYHPALQNTRANLAVLLGEVGDYKRARVLQSELLAVLPHTIANGHAFPVGIVEALVTTLGRLGEYRGARALSERIQQVLLMTLPEEHPHVQRARLNYALVLGGLGDLEAAGLVQEAVLRLRVQSLADDHPDLWMARLAFGSTLIELGNLGGALALLQRAFDAASLRLHDAHPNLQKIRSKLAAALFAQGDTERARALVEKVLEIDSRTLDDDHPELQASRTDYAKTVLACGERAAALKLFWKVHEVCSKQLPEGHRNLQVARGNLAAMVKDLGGLDHARELEEKVLEVHVRTLPPDHRDIQSARQNLAGTIARMGDLERARELFQEVFEVQVRSLPDDHPTLQVARCNLAIANARLRLAEPARRLAKDLARSERSSLLAAARTSSSREVEARAERGLPHLSFLLSLSAGPDGIEPSQELDLEAYWWIETVRGIGLVTAALGALCANDKEVQGLRANARLASAELTRCARNGASRDQLLAAQHQSDRIQGELVRVLSRRLPEGTAEPTEPNVLSLAAKLDDETALISYWRYTRLRWGSEDPKNSSVDSLVAFVLRKDGALHRIELGPASEIEAAVDAWRNSIRAPIERGLRTGVGDSKPDGEQVTGEKVRELVWDPLSLALKGARRVVVAMEDVMCAVPIDALPEQHGRLGDRYRVSLRLTVRGIGDSPTRTPGDRAVVCLGGADFDARPARSENAGGITATTRERLTSPSRDYEAARPAPLASDRNWSFCKLPGTETEARGVAAIAEEVPGMKPTLLLGGNASSTALESASANARVIHVATHGWFAPESLPSTRDRVSIDAKLGLGVSMSLEDQVRGSSPMVLCGLALTGANLPPDDHGQVSGLLTAEEMATWNLRSCELAVLSACVTNVGVRRTGQGVSSLQKALHTAGARSVITSLWTVPDQETVELMLDFYRRLWVEGKPKHQALWEAKMGLRSAKGANGLSTHSPKDWAGWVLSGDSD